MSAEDIAKVMKGASSYSANTNVRYGFLSTPEESPKLAQSIIPTGLRRDRTPEAVRRLAKTAVRRAMGILRIPGCALLVSSPLALGKRHNC